MMNYAPSLKVKAAAELERRRRRGQGNAGPPSFPDFVRQANPRYQWYAHCQQLAVPLARVVAGDLKRLMVFMPPRHSKSETVSRLFTAYYLLYHPQHWVGLTSYAAELAYTLSRSARDHYQRAGGVLRGDVGAVKHWETQQGGGLWAAGVGGPIAGKSGNLLLVDDPLKNAEEAASAVIRAKQQDWFNSTFYTRAEPDAAIIIVQTRWHDDDLSGWLLSQEEGDPEGWHIVNMAAIKEADAPTFPATCTVEPDARPVGTALCPERYPVDKLEKIRARIGAYYWSCLYRQRPTPREGLLFPRARFEIVPASPPHLEWVRYWDKAGAEPGRGDYTVGVLMGRDPVRGGYYVEDVVRGQWGASDRNAVMAQTAADDQERYGRVLTVIEQPPGLGKESTDAAIRALAGYPVEADKVNRDKVDRAEPYAAQVQAGNVKLVAALWNRAYLDELSAFPYGTHDDQVDGSSGAFNRLVAGVSMGVPRPARQVNRWGQL